MASADLLHERVVNQLTEQFGRIAAPVRLTQLSDPGRDDDNGRVPFSSRSDDADRRAPGFPADRWDPVSLRADDGVRLAARHWPAATRDTDVLGIGCVVAHGFTGSAGNPDVQRICRALVATGAGVLAPDLRGHGRSGGATTAGAEEVRDVGAAVRWLRAAGYRRVVVLGWSMGGTSVLRYAGLGGDADAVVSVSAPGSWWERGTRPMRIVHWIFETRTGRVTVRALRRTRVASDAWQTLPEAPAEVAGGIAPRPLLLVHGEDDHYFPLTHIQQLAAAAPTADVWIEPGMGHAELATTDELLARVGGWVLAAVRRVDAVGAVGDPVVCDAGDPVVCDVGDPVVCDDGSRD